MSCDTCSVLGNTECGVKLLAELMVGLYWLASVMNSSGNAFVSIMLSCLERTRFSELATGWTTEETGKFSARARNYSFVQSTQSGSRVHATPYSVGTGVFTAGLK